MPNILQPDKSSRDNLLAFLQTVEPEDLRSLLTDHLQDILAVGRVGTSKESQAYRDGFFAAVEALIQIRLEGKP